MTTILGIETSCDETAAAVVEDGRFIRSNVVFTQQELHRRFGGVVPELASREHVIGIIPAVEKALAEAAATWDDVHAVAVSYGPGLAGSLVVGVNAAKAMALARDIPLVGINHLEGHVYANWLVKPEHWRPTRAGEARREPRAPQFPLLCLIVSGGHSELVLMREHGAYELLGRTRDDAAGEAYDKVAKLLGLGYPGGPVIDRIARTGNDRAILFPSTRLTHADRNAPKGPSHDLLPPEVARRVDFSFSGLKTAVLRYVSDARAHDGTLPEALVADIAASFQRVVVEALLDRTFEAARWLGARSIGIAGGVSANSRLRAEAEARGAKFGIPVFVPPLSLSPDNAAMIGAAGLRKMARDGAGPLDFNAEASLPL